MFCKWCGKKKVGKETICTYCKKPFLTLEESGVTKNFIDMIDPQNTEKDTISPETTDLSNTDYTILESKNKIFKLKVALITVSSVLLCFIVLVVIWGIKGQFSKKTSFNDDIIENEEVYIRTDLPETVTTEISVAETTQITTETTTVTITESETKPTVKTDTETTATSAPDNEISSDKTNIDDLDDLKEINSDKITEKLSETSSAVNIETTTPALDNETDSVEPNATDLEEITSEEAVTELTEEPTNSANETSTSEQESITEGDEPTSSEENNKENE